MNEQTTITYQLNEAEIKAAIIKLMPKKKILPSEIELHVTVPEDSNEPIFSAVIKHEVI